MKREKIPGPALQTVLRLQEAGHEAYLVGGCVRDTLLFEEVKDWDIATSAIPDEVKLLFEHVILTGEKHGTVTVMYNAVGVEVTTFRMDGNYSDNRRPDDVTFVRSLEEDLARRDFTMNAIAYNPTTDKYIDPFHGIEDIQMNRTIRAVGDPMKRFEEDALRMLRMIRFSATKKMRIDNRTFLAVSKQHELIQKVSQERIREELSKILLSDKTSEAFGDLYITGLLDHILPELAACVAFDQRNPHHDKDVFEHILAVVEAIPKDLKLRLAALFHDIAKPVTFSMGEDGIGHFYGHQTTGAVMADEIMNRLRFPNQLRSDVAHLVYDHMTRVPKLRPKNLKRLINRVGEQNIWDLISLMHADIVGHKGPHDFSELDKMIAEIKVIEAEKPPMSLKDLAIGGYELISIGIVPGPFLGFILNKLMELVLDDSNLNSADKLFNIIRDNQEKWHEAYLGNVNNP